MLVLRDDRDVSSAPVILGWLGAEMGPRQYPWELQQLDGPDHPSHAAGGAEWDGPIKAGMNHFVEMTEISMEISRKHFLIFRSIMAKIGVSILSLHARFFFLCSLSLSHFFFPSPLITNFIILLRFSFSLAFHVLYFAA